MKHLLPLALLMACTEQGKAPDSRTPDDGWQLLAEAIPGGLYLAAWPDGTGTTLLVGGDFGADRGILARYDGDSLCIEQHVANHLLWWIHGQNAQDWYAVGAQGTIVHQVAGRRIREDVETTATLFGVYDDGVDVWAVGGESGVGGEVWRRRAGVWSRFGPELPDAAFKVWNGWVVGNGFAYQIEGDALVDRQVPGAPRLLTVYGSGPQDVWAVGGLTGPVMKRHGEIGWTDQEVDPLCSGPSLTGVWTAPGDVVAIAGLSGVTAWLGDDGWRCPSAPLSFQHLHAVTRTAPEELLFAGGDFFGLSNNVGTLIIHGPIKTEFEVLGACE